MDTVARIVVIGLMATLLLPAALPAEQRPDPELREILREAANEIDTFPDRFEAEVWLTDMSGRLARQVAGFRAGHQQASAHVGNTDETVTRDAGGIDFFHGQRDAAFSIPAVEKGSAYTAGDTMVIRGGAQGH